MMGVDLGGGWRLDRWQNGNVTHWVLLNAETDTAHIVNAPIGIMLHALIARAEAAEAKVAALTAALQLVEFSDRDKETGAYACYECGWPQGHGHHPKCIVGKALEAS